MRVNILITTLRENVSVQKEKERSEIDETKVAVNLR